MCLTLNLLYLLPNILKKLLKTVYFYAKRIPEIVPRLMLAWVGDHSSAHRARKPAQGHREGVASFGMA